MSRSLLSRENYRIAYPKMARAPWKIHSAK